MYKLFTPQLNEGDISLEAEGILHDIMTKFLKARQKGSVPNSMYLRDDQACTLVYSFATFMEIPVEMTQHL